MIKTLTASVALAAAFTVTQPYSYAEAQSAVTAPKDDTKLLAVTSFAEWCGSCKALDPKIDAVRGANTFEGVEFAKIDYTDRDADTFFAQADTLGVGETMRGQFPDKIKTGKMFLIDMTTGQIVSQIDKSMTEEEIASEIESAAT